MINSTDPTLITVYYIDEVDNTIVYETIYHILSNIITITPSSGDKTTIYTADLNQVDLVYDELSITSTSEGLLDITNINESNKLITFKYTSKVNEVKNIEFSDNDDVFIASFTNIFLNDPPTDINLTPLKVYRYAFSDTYIGTFSSVDEDDTEFTYSLINNETYIFNDYFYINDDILLLDKTLPSTYDTCTIKARTLDSENGFLDKEFTINIYDCSLTYNKVYENSPINTYIGSFECNHSTTYSITLNNEYDYAYFNISNSMLYTSYSFNYETKQSYNISVKFTDSDGFTFNKVFNIDILNINEAPTILSLSNNTIYENNTINQVIGTLYTNINDNVVTYTLDNSVNGTDNIYFTLNSNTILANSIFNYEEKREYTIAIKSSHIDGEYITKLFTIYVLNVNESPISIYLDNTSIYERVSINTPVGSFSGTDPDENDVLTFTLVNGSGSTHNSYYSIVNGTLITSKIVKYNLMHNTIIRVRATDNGGLYTEQVFNIEIMEISKQPYNIINARRYG